jgi:hypothetical protein
MLRLGTKFNQKIFCAIQNHYVAAQGFPDSGSQLAAHQAASLRGAARVTLAAQTLDEQS